MALAVWPGYDDNDEVYGRLTPDEISLASWLPIRPDGETAMRDLSMHVLDIVQNSIKAGAKLIVVSFVRNAEGILTFTVKDDGCGMSP